MQRGRDHGGGGGQGVEVTGRGGGHGEEAEVTGRGRGHREGSEVMVGEEGRERGQKSRGKQMRPGSAQAWLRPGRGLPGLLHPPLCPPGPRPRASTCLGL